MSTVAEAADQLSSAVKQKLKLDQVKGVRSGTVKDVQATTCTVVLKEGLELYGVRYNSIDATIENRFTVKPKEGSKVLVAIIENLKTEAVIISYSEIDEVYCQIGTTIWRVKANKIKVEAAGETLKAVINDIISEIQKIVVLYGRGPDIAALTAINIRLNLILE